MAVVEVLPDPEAPRSPGARSLPSTPFTGPAIACGWSPFGSNSDTTRKARPPSDLSGRGGRGGIHGGRLRMFGSPSSSSALSESADTAAPVRPRGWLSGAGLSNLGWGPSPNPCVSGSRRAGLSSSARCSPSGWTSGREALDFGPGADFRGAGMSGIWGESEARKRATTEYVAPARPNLELRALLSTSYGPSSGTGRLRQAAYLSGDLG